MEGKTLESLKKDKLDIETQIKQLNSSILMLTGMLKYVSNAIASVEKLAAEAEKSIGSSEGGKDVSGQPKELSPKAGIPSGSK